MTQTIQSFVNCNVPTYQSIQYRLNGTGSYSSVTISGWRNFENYLDTLAAALHTAGVTWSINYNPVTDLVTFTNNGSSTYQFKFTDSQATLLGFASTTTASTSSDFTSDTLVYGACPLNSIHAADVRPARNADIKQFRHGATSSTAWGSGMLTELNVRGLYANIDRIQAGPCGVSKVRVGTYGSSTVFSSSALGGYIDCYLLNQNSAEVIDDVEQNFESSFSAFIPTEAHTQTETFTDTFFGSLKAGFSFMYYCKVEGFPYLFTEKATGLSSTAFANHTEKAQLVLNPDTSINWKTDRFAGLSKSTGLTFGILDSSNSIGIFKRPTKMLQLGGADFAIDGTTVTIDANSGDFSTWGSSGSFYLGKEYLTYASKGSNTLGNITRGTYGPPYPYTRKGGSKWKTVSDTPISWVGRIVEFWAGLLDEFGNPVFSDFDDSYTRQLYTGNIDSPPAFENGVWSFSTQDLLHRFTTQTAPGATGHSRAGLYEKDLGSILIGVRSTDVIQGFIKCRSAGNNNHTYTQKYSLNVLEELQDQDKISAGSGGFVEYRSLIETIFKSIEDIDVTGAQDEAGDFFSAVGGTYVKAEMNISLAEDKGGFKSTDGVMGCDVRIHREATSHLITISSGGFNSATGEPLYYWQNVEKFGTDVTTPGKMKKATGKYSVSVNPGSDFILTTNGVAEVITSGATSGLTASAIASAINTAAAGDPKVGAASSTNDANLTADNYGDTGNGITLDITTEGGGNITKTDMSGGDDGDEFIVMQTGLNGKTCKYLTVKSFSQSDHLLGSFTSSGYVTVGSGKNAEVIKYSETVDKGGGLLVIAITERNVTGSAGQDVLKDELQVRQALLVEQNPAVFLAQMMQSTGTGSTASPGPRGAYDVLNDFGYGIDDAHILDVTSTASLYSRAVVNSIPLPAKISAVIDEPRSIKETFSGLLLASRMALGWVRDGQRLKIGAIPSSAQGDPSEPYVTITDKDLALNNPVSIAYVNTGPNIVEVSKSKSSGTINDDKMTFRLLQDIDAKGGKKSNVNLFGLSDSSFKVVASALAMGIVNATPYQVAYKLKVSSWLDWTIGTFVKLDGITHGGIWDWNNNTTGIDGFGRVVEVSRNLSTQEIEITVLVNGQIFSRALCPVARVTTSSGADLTVTFPSIFSGGDTVLVYTPGIAASYQELTITNIAGSVITLSSTPTLVVNNFTVLTYPSDDNAGITDFQNQFSHVNDGGGWEA